MHANFNHLRFVLAAVLLTGLTACGFELTTSLETQDVEAQISDDLALQKGIRAEIECPEDVEAREGGEFECKATDAEGTSASVAVVQTNDSGSVDWTMDVMNVLAVEKKMSREVGKKVHTPIDVTCPRVIVPATKGASVDCRATDDMGGEGVLRITLSDTAGDVSWELNP